jgi:hypothetical protein
LHWRTVSRIPSAASVAAAATLVASPTRAASAVSEDSYRTEVDRSPQVAVHPTHPAGGLPPAPTRSPNPSPQSLTTQRAGFAGLTHLDQRNAGTGSYTDTQFSLEPPDQGLCADSQFVVEAVNNAIAVYSPAGRLLAGPTPLSAFFGLAPETNRNSDPNNPDLGPFTSDPKCLYDTATHTWFLTQLMENNGNNAGANGRSYQLIAVSTGSDPTGSWAISAFDVTDDGVAGTPNDPGCPCLGDQPLLGADSNGIYITTNEFGLSGSAFNGAHVYALSKSQLVGAADGSYHGNVPVAAVDASQALVPYGGLSYSLQPAVSSPGATPNRPAGPDNRHGTEYFLSALQFGAPPYEALDNRIAVWALTGTEHLGVASPDLHLSLTVVGTQTYGQPAPLSNQKPGPTPLRDSLRPDYHNPIESIDTGDDRMNQVSLAGGVLWGGLNTVLGNGSRTGVAVFGITPSWSGATLKATVTAQSYVSVDRDSLFYPSVAVNNAGNGVVAFTLAGPEHFPSAAYVPISSGVVGGQVRIVAAGKAPDDGFTGYAPYSVPGTPSRWGDYSAATVLADGSVWMAAEYIPGGPRTSQANWGTYLTHVTP